MKAVIIDDQREIAGKLLETSRLHALRCTGAFGSEPVVRIAPASARARTKRRVSVVAVYEGPCSEALSIQLELSLMSFTASYFSFKRRHRGQTHSAVRRGTDLELSVG